MSKFKITEGNYVPFSAMGTSYEVTYTFRIAREQH